MFMVADDACFNKLLQIISIIHAYPLVPNTDNPQDLNVRTQIEAICVKICCREGTLLGSLCITTLAQ